MIDTLFSEVNISTSKEETTISPLAQGVQADSKSVCSSEEQGVGSIPTGGTIKTKYYEYKR